MNMKIYKKLSSRVFACSLLLIFSLIFGMTARADEIFAELADTNSVESTYISGRMAHNMQLWRNITGTHAMNFSEGFSSLYTYQCYSAEAVTKARKILDAYLKKNPDMEIVMRTREASGEYVIYERFSNDNLLMQMIIWSSDAPNVCEIVVVDWKDGLKR